MAKDTSRLAVVTGAGSGIGRAVALALSHKRLTVLAVGRRLPPLKETADMATGGVRVLNADVATAAGRAAIVDELGGDRVHFLVHAAGTMPIQRLADITPDTWGQVMATNVDARLHLTQALVPSLTPGGRVLFIGSMSATKPRKGSTAYCTSLAASFMLQQCLKLELAQYAVLVTNAIPGPVNTRMLQAGMVADADVFPDRDEYGALREQGKLIEPETVGHFYAWLLTQTDDQSYSANQWDIRDQSHHAAWIGSRGLYEAN
ncbi:MAG: SDR family oxidoreductase [Gammaproteobacteria bacterium]|jgi:NAD(P)-dependent dehydrogenase (short-subunit alcohol dehydrogenase family)|nr:SDR family oxidoreductase [Gammaproteobacteria bacterium]